MEWPAHLPLVRGGGVSFRLQMSNLSAGEGRASEARGEDTITPYSSVEMGKDYYGFCDMSSTDSETT